MRESAKQCRSIADFIQPPTTSMPSLATNNQEPKNNSDGDDAVTCELQDQGGATLNVEKYTSASFTTQPSLSTSGFIVPESVLSIVATSEHTASTNDKESDIPLTEMTWFLKNIL